MIEILTGHDDANDYELYLNGDNVVCLGVMPMFGGDAVLRLTDEQAQALAGGIMKALYTKWSKPRAGK